MPTKQEAYTVASRAVKIFRDNDLSCCLFGSAACALHGMTRVPNDVDLLVLTDEHSTSEKLKELLTAHDDRFYLTPSRNPNATYRVLWYRLTPYIGRSERKCKVDILVPGFMNLPRVPAVDEIWHPHVPVFDDAQTLPVMPLIPLLLMKLQGWTDHRDSDRSDMLLKVPVDLDDIGQLLRIATNKQVPGIQHSSLSWLPRDFVLAAQRRVYEFVEVFPDLAGHWRGLGFKVEA